MPCTLCMLGRSSFVKSLASHGTKNKNKARVGPSVCGWSSCRFEKMKARWCAWGRRPSCCASFQCENIFYAASQQTSECGKQLMCWHYLYCVMSWCIIRRRGGWNGSVKMYVVLKREPSKWCGIAWVVFFSSSFSLDDAQDQDLKIFNLGHKTSVCLLY